jgi:hypothetical protein
MPQLTISERDAGYPDFDRSAFETELSRRSGALELDRAS